MYQPSSTNHDAEVPRDQLKPLRIYVADIRPGTPLHGSRPKCNGISFKRRHTSHCDQHTLSVITLNQNRDWLHRNRDHPIENRDREITCQLLNAKRLDATVRAESAMPERVPYPRLPSMERAPAARKWKSLLWSIECAEQHGEEGLRGLAVALSKLLVAEALQALVLEAKQFSGCGLEAEVLLWDMNTPLNGDGDTLATLMRRKKKRVKVDMSDAIVLPATWERWRFFGALAKIGQGRPWGPWKHDKRNHFAQGWLPWPIVWVMNGNHSAMAGLVRGGGASSVKKLLT